MFHPPNRSLNNLVTGLATNHYLPKRAHPVLSLFGYLHRALAIGSLKFCASWTKMKRGYYSEKVRPSYEPNTSDSNFNRSPEKSVKPRGLKDIGMSNSFEIRSTKFTLHITEIIEDKSKIISITEFELTSRQHIRQIWLSILAAQILLEKVEEVSKLIDINNVESTFERHFIRFFDDERNRLIELSIADGFYNIFYLKVSQNTSDLERRSNIFIPLDGIMCFKENLAASLRKYEKMSDPNREKSIEKIRKSRSFFFEPKRYFLGLMKSNVTGNILVQLGELNTESNKKRNMLVPIIDSRTLFSVLGNAYKIIRCCERRLPSGKQAHDVLHEKSFVHQDREYRVQVVVSEPLMRRFGDMILLIKSQNLENENLRSLLIIRSRGVHLLLKHYEEILHEYDRLKPTLIDAGSSKCSAKEEQQKRSLDQELDALKIETGSKVTEVKNWESTEDDRRNVIARLDRSLPISQSK